MPLAFEKARRLIGGDASEDARGEDASEDARGEDASEDARGEDASEDARGEEGGVGPVRLAGSARGLLSQSMVPFGRHREGSCCTGLFWAERGLLCDHLCYLNAVQMLVEAANVLVVHTWRSATISSRLRSIVCASAKFDWPGE
jgi:hypothetical protein